MKRILFILLLLPLFGTVCHAEGLYGQIAETTGLYEMENALGEREKAISGEISADGSYDAGGALKRLWERLIEDICDSLRKEAGFAGKLLSIALFSSLAAALTDNKHMQEGIAVLACCTVSLLIAGNLDGVIGEATDALMRLSDFSKAAMPVLFTAAAASGAVSSASVRYASACLALDVFISTAQRIVIPTIYAYLSLSISSGVFENTLIRTAARLSRWCAVTAMTAVTLAFSAYMAISGVIAGSTDAIAVKTAKTVISSALPVVGGILSDSASLLLSAASVIRNTAGVFSLIGVCALCAGPFASLGVKMLLYKATAAAADILPGGRLSRLINEMGSAFGMLLSLVGCCGIMLFLSIMSGMRAVSGI